MTKSSKFATALNHKSQRLGTNWLDIQSRDRAIWVVVLVLLACTTGCDPQQANAPKVATSNTTKTDTVNEANSDFRRAIDFLDNYHEYDPTQVSERIMYRLQRWADTQQPDPDWIAHPIFKRLPKRFEGMQGKAFLSRTSFQPFDIVILREALWCRDISKQIIERPLHDVRLAKWLESQSDTLDNSDHLDLEAAANLFDWVVRNIQLEAVMQATEETPDVPPPGAKYLPSDAMLAGRGDWLVRARIVNLMARQLEIPSIMIGVEDDDATRTWCVAFLINKQLYLFDTRLGLPIPTKNGVGIATLEQVINDPSLLRQLDDPDGEPYPISEDDLSKLTGLIDATPEYLSQRMKLTEAQLTGDKRLVLTAAPSPLILELRNCKGIGSNVALWELPYDVYLYRQGLRVMPPYLMEINYENNFVDGPTPLANARRQHFRGNYRDDDFEPGAKSFYMQCRVPESEIRRMNDKDSFGKFMGLAKSWPKDEDVQQRLIDRIRSQIRKAKQYASYWLGIVAFEEGNYKVAESYFTKRTLEAEGETPWKQGAIYNLGRTYEQMGLTQDDPAMLAKARDYYLKNADSDDAAGNRIRAKLLK